MSALACNPCYDNSARLFNQRFPNCFLILMIMFCFGIIPSDLIRSITVLLLGRNARLDFGGKLLQFCLTRTHSTASVLFDKGWDLESVKSWLRHADIETTSNIYLHISNGRKRLMAKDMAGTFTAPYTSDEGTIDA